MRATQQEALDLGHLAIDRARDAVGSVMQLMDPDDPRTQAVMTAVALDMIVASAACLQDGMEAQNGKRPPTRDALAHVIAEIVTVLDQPPTRDALAHVIAEIVTVLDLKNEKAKAKEKQRA